jgi:hypothetical protein
MRKTAPFILAMLTAGSMVQAATAAEQTRNAEDTVAVAQDPHHRRAQNQLSESSSIAPLTAEEERNRETFGFSGRSPSRPGGEDPNLNPPD